jgi:protein-L-isoaspartate(D-aspartate) O-methyltransferase
MIIPVGERYQQTLYRVTKRGNQLEREPLEATLFVPMTGAAEEAREVQPNPLKPEAANGGFEQLVGTTAAPSGWHYLRQAGVKRHGSAEADGRYLEFHNEQPGRSSQGLQGFAIDGRKVSKLRLAARVRGAGLAPDPAAGGSAAVIVSFFDERRAAIDYAQLGPWTGSFDWRKVEVEVSVPLATREAIIAIGLHGGTGRLDMDDIEISAVASP